MKIPLNGHTLYVSFTNKSERVAHDAPPRDVMERLKALLVVKNIRQTRSKSDRRAPEEKTILALDPRLKPYLKLRTPHCISTITTTCVISDERGGTVATGYSYYSRDEVTHGRPFDRTTAKRKSLARALHEFSKLDRDEVLRTFEQILARPARPTVATSSHTTK